MLQSLHAPGAEMDEGLLLAYPLRVLHGAVPQRDFESFYGPGSPWLLAVIFKLFGATLMAERFVGLVYRLSLVGLVFVFAGGWGSTVAAGAALIAAALLLGTGLAATASIGALTLALSACALARTACKRTGETHSELTAAAAGLFVAASAALRPELLLMSAAGVTPFLITMRRRAAVALTVSAAVGTAAVWIPHILTVGGRDLARNLSDLSAALPGRAHPISQLDGEVSVLILSTALETAGLAVSARTLWATRQRPGPPDGERVRFLSILALALFCLTQLPYSLTQADKIHILPVAAVGIGACGTPFITKLAQALPDSYRRWRPLVAVAVTTFLAVAVAPSVIPAAVANQVRLLLGMGDPQPGFVVQYRTRSFIVSSAAEANAAQAIVNATAARAAPGDSLFVGPMDLRRANYDDTYLYYLLAQLRPASFYMELNPLTANRPGSGLAHDVARATFLILNRRWDDWTGPPATKRNGPDLPNKVVGLMFCRIISVGTYTLYERCRRGIFDHPVPPTAVPRSR